MMKDGQNLGLEGIRSWNAPKWCLLLSVISVFTYGLAGFFCAILTWFKAWPHADVIVVADNDILLLTFLASTILLLTASLGLTGTLLSSRPLLALYALLLWPALLALAAIGYAAYKRSAFALDRKLNRAWSEWYTPLGRLVVQDALRCCGYTSALHDAVASRTCFARSALPGCKAALLRLERRVLGSAWAAAFALVPVHIANIVVALLCANHVNEQFGKRIMPRRYWLRAQDVTAAEAAGGGRRVWEEMCGDMDEFPPVVLPELSRTGGAVFREDREERQPLLW